MDEARKVWCNSKHMPMEWRKSLLDSKRQNNESNFLYFLKYLRKQMSAKKQAIIRHFLAKEKKQGKPVYHFLTSKPL